MDYTFSFKMWRMCDKNLLDCMRIDIEVGRGMTTLGLQLVKWVKKGASRERKAHCP